MVKNRSFWKSLKDFIEASRNALDESLKQVLKKDTKKSQVTEVVPPAISSSWGKAISGFSRIPKENKPTAVVKQKIKNFPVSNQSIEQRFSGMKEFLKSGKVEGSALNSNSHQRPKF